VKRRDLIVALGGLLTAPNPLLAQRKTTPVVGLLSPFAPAETEAWHQAFREGMRNLGWIEGSNFKIEYRFADGLVDRLPELVADLIKLKVDVILASVTPDALAAAEATKTIPIVMAAAGDPVATGLVPNLARPGGNVTGMSQMLIELIPKRLELLKEIAPHISRVAFLSNPEDDISVLAGREAEAAARGLRMETHSILIDSKDQFEVGFTAAISAGVNALMPMPSPIFVNNSKLIADFAMANRLPSIFHLQGFARAGGLMAYGPGRSHLFRRAASYVDKIIRGANPGDLPVEQPTKFELALNLKTATTIGLAVPGSFISRADEIIE
jgi:putative ABC transport system substrate-binding protein